MMADKQITDEEIREHMTMKLFNFYLDDLTKLRVMRQLESVGVNTTKGTLASLIRVLLKYFSELIDDDPTLLYLVEKTKEEYIFTTKKNKRSKL